MGTTYNSRRTGSFIIPDMDGPMFEYFPKLPLELRRMIILKAIEVPRIIRVSESMVTTRDRVTGLRMREYFADIDEIDRDPPSLLLVDHEVRDFALEHYQWAFHGRLQKPIYFNFAVDYIYYEDGMALGYFEDLHSTQGFGTGDPDDTHRKLQHVIVGAANFEWPFEDYSIDGPFVGNITYIMRMYKSLNTLLFETPREGRISTERLSSRLEQTVRSIRKTASQFILHDIYMVSPELISEMIEEKEFSFQDNGSRKIVGSVADSTGNTLRRGNDSEGGFDEGSEEKTGDNADGEDDDEDYLEDKDEEEGGAEEELEEQYSLFVEEEEVDDQYDDDEERDGEAKYQDEVGERDQEVDNHEYESDDDGSGEVEEEAEHGQEDIDGHVRFDWGQDMHDLMGDIEIRYNPTCLEARLRSLDLRQQPSREPSRDEQNIQRFTGNIVIDDERILIEAQARSYGPQPQRPGVYTLTEDDHLRFEAEFARLRHGRISSGCSFPFGEHLRRLEEEFEHELSDDG